MNPFLTLPQNPNYLRRCKNHDYTWRGKYLVTIKKGAGSPVLSAIAGDLSISGFSDPAAPHSELTTAGRCIEAAIKIWLEKYPQIRLARYVIMPDHVHLCINVINYLEPGLSRVMSSLMGAVTREFKKLTPGHQEKFFSKGFNDKIAFDDEQWNRQLHYVSDNPRRYLMKKYNPDLFYTRWQLTIGDKSFAAVGNIFLLKSPALGVVRFSRKYARGEFESKAETWRQITRNGGALISPFIHPKEKEIRDRALASGGKIIRICENGFSERFAPQGREFEFVGSSRMLLIAPLEHHSQKEDMSYEKAQSMNSIAEMIAEADWIGGGARISLLR